MQILGGYVMNKIWAGLFGVVMAAGAAGADPVTGTWKTQPGDDGNYAFVEITTCGTNICGTMAQAYDAKGKAVDSAADGKPMIWDMKSKGNGTYRGGKIWAPDRDKTYNSRMTLSGSTLEVEGCVLFICRGQTWTRVK
jgi:uncharacterized protein (DUF2147 family)